MNAHAALLAWLQIHDSAFPSGRFVHSNGMEAWLHTNPDADTDAVCSLAMAFVRYGSATLDAVATAHSWAATDIAALVEIDELLTSYKLSHNARQASQVCGRRLAGLLVRLGVPNCSPTADYLAAVREGRVTGNLAVVEGSSQRALDIGQIEAVLGSVRSAYCGVLQAAVRVGRLGAIRAQQELLSHQDDLVGSALTAIETPLEEMHSDLVELEICGMQHETRRGRLFST